MIKLENSLFSPPNLVLFKLQFTSYNFWMKLVQQKLHGLG